MVDDVEADVSAHVMTERQDAVKPKKENKTSQIKLHPSWVAQLADEFEKPYMRQLKQFLRAERAAGKVIYPAGKEMFAALNRTPYDATKVVILGQDKLICSHHVLYFTHQIHFEIN